MTGEAQLTFGLPTAATRYPPVGRPNRGFRRPSRFGDAAPAACRPGWRRIWRFAAGLLLAGLLSVPVRGAGAEGVQVRFDGHRIEITLDVVLAAPEAALDEVIHDYDHLDRVFPLVVSSGLLSERADGVQRVRADMEGCLLIFCRRLRHVLDIHRAERGWSSAVSVPRHSDVRAGHFSWHTQALDAERTRFRFSGQVEPDVWIPPVIGPVALRRAVQRSFADAMPRLERAARERAR